MILLTLVFPFIHALAVTSCETCNADSWTLHVDQFFAAQRYPKHHSLLNQWCVPDEYNGLVKHISIQLTYWITPRTLNSYEGFKCTTVPTSAWMWIEVYNSDFERTNMFVLRNKTSISEQAPDAWCIELRGSANVGKTDAYDDHVYVRYEGEVWWFT
jgi:hypothetical protein